MSTQWNGTRWLTEVAGGLSALRELDAQIATRLVYGSDELGRLCFGLITHRPPGKPQLSEAVSVGRSLRDADGTWILLLTLEDATFADVFVQLCTHIYAKVAAQPTEAAGMKAAMACLNEWRELFQSRSSKRLTLEAARGLFAELSFGFDVAASTLQPSRIAECWEGPYGADQDFAFLNTQVEIKSKHPNSRNLQISSEYQLDGDHLILGIVEVDDSRHPLPGYTSLGDLARRVMESVSDNPHASELISDAFEELNFDPLDDYYNEVYFKRNMLQFFEISEGFPKIRPQDLMIGVGRVKYQIELDALLSFEVTTEYVLEQISERG